MDPGRLANVWQAKINETEEPKRFDLPSSMSNEISKFQRRTYWYKVHGETLGTLEQAHFQQLCGHIRGQNQKTTQCFCLSLNKDQTTFQIRLKIQEIGFLDFDPLSQGRFPHLPTQAMDVLATERLIHRTALVFLIGKNIATYSD